MLEILNDVSTVTELMLLEVGSEDPSDEFIDTHQNLTISRLIDDGVPKLFLESQCGPRIQTHASHLHN